VLRAELLSRGGNTQALEPLIARLAEQQKAVAACIRRLEA
jgi:hypothetical protein